MLNLIDIVLPCYNPPKNWQKELLEFYYDVKFNFNVKFILVNDGSVNSNFEAALPKLKELNIPFEVISYAKNRGKGYALRKGVEFSTADYIVYTDIDFPFTNKSVIGVMSAVLNNTADVLAGTRSELYYQKNMSTFRKLLSKAFRFVLKRLLKMKISDTQCGLKAFNTFGRREFLNTKINRYLFDFEFIYTSSKREDLRILPVEAELKDNVVFSKMKLKILMQESLNLLKVIFFSK